MRLTKKLLVRTLQCCVGYVLRCGAYLAGLRRTKVGDWKIEDAITPDRAAWGNVLPLKEILKGFTGFQLSEREWNDISHGRSIEHRGEELEHCMDYLLFLLN
jgi:tRNA U55 pseudouridine synthase TruB